VKAGDKQQPQKMKLTDVMEFFFTLTNERNSKSRRHFQRL
jgi:hypothetical protein